MFRHELARDAVPGAGWGRVRSRSQPLPSEPGEVVVGDLLGIAQRSVAEALSPKF
jgi:hypothetical protein